MGPPARWRFHEPAIRGQRWHITRADFYSEDVVRGGDTKGACNAYGKFKLDGQAISVSEIDQRDQRYCRHCLRMVALGH